VQCLHRWTKILKPGLIKGPWTIEEDKKLAEWVKNTGPNKWSQCADFIAGRSGKQCRERWCNSLCPGVKKGNWTSDEDYTIFKLYSEYGSKWAKIAGCLKGRTENSIKNRFYSTLRRLAYEKQKKDNLATLSKEKFISQKDLLQYLPEAIKEKEYFFNLERQQQDVAVKNGLPIDDTRNKKVKVKKIIFEGKPTGNDTTCIDARNKPVKASNAGPNILNNINVNFNTVFTPTDQINQYLSNLLLMRMNCLENLYYQTKTEVNNFNNLGSQFINMYNFMYQNVNNNSFSTNNNNPI
jgi:hypothetical protein